MLTPEAVADAVACFEKLKKELKPVVDGMGLQGLVLTVATDEMVCAECRTRTRTIWDFAEIAVGAGGCLIGTRREDPGEGKPIRYCRAYVDPARVMSIEFEVFPEK